MMHLHLGRPNLFSRSNVSSRESASPWRWVVYFWQRGFVRMICSDGMSYLPSTRHLTRTVVQNDAWLPNKLVRQYIIRKRCSWSWKTRPWRASLPESADESTLNIYSSCNGRLVGSCCNAKLSKKTLAGFHQTVNLDLADDQLMELNLIEERKDGRINRLVK